MRKFQNRRRHGEASVHRFVSGEKTFTQYNFNIVGYVVYGRSLTFLLIFLNKYAFDVLYHFSFIKCKKTAWSSFELLSLNSRGKLLVQLQSNFIIFM
jgi:hypothetical protein